jgi:carbon monoxide dehydrogenase subunit G
MILTTSQIEITLPRQQVFNFIVDPSKSTLWHAGVIDISADRSMAENSSGEITMQILGRRIESRFSVLENDGIGFTKVHSNHGPITYETTQILEELAPRLTRVTIQTKIDAGTVFRLAEPALESIANSMMESDLKTLKAVLESPA